ncbi:bile acid:sodium symporter family protein [Gordonia sp. CPCC 205515]|uniref:bile acid:sodium symporter family protein n=1 Tax=Gordonia sp. CPCC 205515 TaxID=3140791 RepID=UPI003AF4064A
MESSFISVGLPVALAVIMFGLGLSLTVADFRRVLTSPRAIAIILACQMLLLPLIAFGLAVVFDLEPYLAVGVMILAASPGGTAASIYSHLFRGDVALNVTLTAINSLLGLITLPIVINLALGHFLDSDESVDMQPAKLMQVFAAVLIPVAIGMVVRSRWPRFAERADRPVRVASILLLAGVVAGALFGEEEAIDYFVRVGVVTALFCVLSLTLGYVVPRVSGLTHEQSVASGFEVGIHNATLAITVALSVLGNSEMGIVPAVYGILMFPLAALFGLLVRYSTRKNSELTGGNRA